MNRRLWLLRLIMVLGVMLGGGIQGEEGSGTLTAPWAEADLVFAEKDGQVAVEAEFFVRQTGTQPRAWYITDKDRTPRVMPDGDAPHGEGASGGAYVEVLPDTRRTHQDRLISGENFSEEPGRLAVLHYPVHFRNPGRYYVWVRGYSTGTEDNGLHVGLNGAWPASGQRMQWCDAKNTWRWESKQRTEDEHCGVPHAIYLDVLAAGIHEIQFSMREDGFEFDKFLLTLHREMEAPQGEGPKSEVHRGRLPGQGGTTEKEKESGGRSRFPDHWGDPPRIQTTDYRPLPGGYGFGSSTLASWIQRHLDADRDRDGGGAPSEPGLPRR
jgi:hypothetical protein